jgi:hypothetical protein
MQSSSPARQSRRFRPASKASGAAPGEMLTTEDTEDTEFLAKRLRGCYRASDLRAKTSMFDAKRRAQAHSLLPSSVTSVLSVVSAKCLQR